jgi:dUTP pyrophosphatase
MIVRTKILDKSIKTPELKYARPGDAGIDLTATSKWYDEFGNTCYGTNRAFEIPEGFVGLLFPRSSNSKTDLRLTNSVGVLDSGYRGEVMFKYRNDNYIKVEEDKFLFKKGVLGFSNEPDIGDRVGQLIIMPYPKVKLVEVDELSETERGEGSYGSTGK